MIGAEWGERELYINEGFPQLADPHVSLRPLHLFRPLIALFSRSAHSLPVRPGPSFGLASTPREASVPQRPAPTETALGGRRT